MSEEMMIQSAHVRKKIRHKGRMSQVGIYLGKQFRFFINQSDWKVLPMAAVIAALVAMVIQNKFFVNMEGGLFGAFALTCVAIWNGCFNSIQAVCRERPIIKREHRSGMHISAYVAAHMIYQLLLCTAQTGISLYVMQLVGLKFPAEGFMTDSMIVDIGISMLLISYASDVMSLLISSLSHTTTGAMTVMPFVLIFQLVFSGGIIPLPEWSQSIANFTISNYGLKAIAAQAGYNEAPMVTSWQVLEKMKDKEIGGTVTVGELMDFLGRTDNETLNSRRDTVILPAMTEGEAAAVLDSAADSLGLKEQEVLRAASVRSLLERIADSETETMQQLRDYQLIPAIGNASGITVGDILNGVLSSEETQGMLDTEVGTTVTLGEILDTLQEQAETGGLADQQFSDPVTLGQAIDFLVNNKLLQENRDRTLTLKTTVGELMNLFGEENVKQTVQETTAAASRNPDYERSFENIMGNWLMLGLFILVFAFLATLSLELIDKDKR